MKILVSGATGFVGTHLLPKLAAAGHEVRAVSRDEGSLDSLMEIMANGRFDGVIHLASLFLKDHRSEDLEPLLESNILFGTRLLEAAARHQVSWFINTGSYWEHAEDGSYAPANLYAATKHAFEKISGYYADSFHINFITLKLFDNFGPGDTRPKIFNLWEKIAATGETLEMSPGGQLIDITYIENVIDAYLRGVELLAEDNEHKLHGKAFAISSGERMTLKELAVVFEEETDKKLSLAWGAKPYRPREVMVPWKTGEALPGWKPRIPLREGIRRTF